MTGYPSSDATPSASSTEWAKPERGSGRPASCMVRTNRRRSSARRMASRSAPIIRTPFSSRAPDSARATATLSPVWPPRVGSKASGRSRSMIARTASGVSGSTYVASANSGSVMIVAGFELTRTIR
jgi:hypothetical protein